MSQRRENGRYVNFAHKLLGFVCRQMNPKLFLREREVFLKILLLINEFGHGRDFFSQNLVSLSRMDTGGFFLYKQVKLQKSYTANPST